MYIDHVRTFIEVNTAGSFQIAAERLCVTQSTVSARIKTLESYLNRRLFFRKRDGVQLTSGGMLFMQHAQILVSAWQQAVQAVSLPQEVKAVVHLGVQINHWEHISTPWLAWMENNDAKGECATQVISEYSSTLMQLLRDGLLDLAVLYEPQHVNGFRSQLLTTEKLTLVSTENTSIKNVFSRGYVHMDWGESFLRQFADYYPNNPSPKLHVSQAEVALQHILTHGGAAYLLDKTIRNLVRQGKLFQVANAKQCKQSLYLVTQNNAEEKTNLQRAIQGLKAVV